MTLENEFDYNKDPFIHLEFDYATCESQTVTFAVNFANSEIHFALF